MRLTRRERACATRVVLLALAWLGVRALSCAPFPFASRSRRLGPRVASSPARGYVEECAPSSELRAGVTVSDVDALAESVARANAHDDPFEFAQLCEPWSEETYAALSRAFPPAGRVRDLGRTRTEAEGARFGMTIESLIERVGASKTLQADYPGWEVHTETLQRAATTLREERVEAALFEKFRLDRNYTRSQINIQVDHENFYIGLHTDVPMKVLTVQFYFPVDASTLYTQGTCVHTREQYAAALESARSNRRADMAQSDQRGSSDDWSTQMRRFLVHTKPWPCDKKFTFSANSGYVFVRSSKSYHSLERVSGPERRTIMINYYRDE
jgi:hypothetical protein